MYFLVSGLLHSFSFLHFIQYFIVSFLYSYLLVFLLLCQSGCCKPPTACNFTYVNETYWDKPAGFTSSNIQDCNTWNNDQSTLCYDCQSCKAGVLANIKRDWKKVAIVNIIFLIFLIIVYSIGCCAFRNNRRDNSYQGYNKAYP